MAFAATSAALTSIIVARRLSEGALASYLDFAFDKTQLLSIALKERNEDALRELIPFIHTFLNNEEWVPHEQIVGIRLREGRQVLVEDKPKAIYGESVSRRIGRRIGMAPPIMESVLKEESLGDFARLVLDTGKGCIEQYGGRIQGEKTDITNKDVEATREFIIGNGMSLELRQGQEEEKYLFDRVPVERVSLPVEKR